MSLSQKFFHFQDHNPTFTDLKSDVLIGLQQKTKTLDPKLLYDQRGSALFECITTLPEYYLTRTEESILAECSKNIAARIGRNATIIELGSGSSKKVQYLLDTLFEPDSYIAVDISKNHLLQSIKRLALAYPHIQMSAVCADYHQLSRLPTRSEKRVLFFPGSTIGNFEPYEAQFFLTRMANLLSKGEHVLIGIDLKKDKKILHQAYNDANGVTAQFNLNVLRRINCEWQGDFDLQQFHHVAFYNQRKGRIEMHVESLIDQTVTIDDHQIAFRKGETIHTENSYKYTMGEFKTMSEQSGFKVGGVWTDVNNWFSVQLLTVT